MTPHQIKEIAERQFEKAVGEFKQAGYLFRLPDTSDIRARFKKATGQDTLAHLPKSPADFVVTVNSSMFYAEVKGTETDTFRLNRIEKAQLAAMIRQCGAGGKYFVFIYQIMNNEWFCVPAHYFVSNHGKTQPITTIKLSNLRKEFGRGTDPLNGCY